MAKRSTTKKKTRGKKKAAGRIGARIEALRGVQWSKARPWLLTTGWTMGVVAVIVAWAMGVPRLRAAVAEAAWRSDVAIEFENLPNWVNGDLLAMLELTARGQLSGDPLKQEDLAGVLEALENSGWFESIEQVRRVRVDLVRITGKYVKPFSVIRDGEGDHLVDPQGRLLPRSYDLGEAGRFIIITGAHFDRPQRPRAQWDGSDVTAALRLLRLIDSKPWREQVKEIDTSAYLTGESLVLVTDEGSRIVWGSAPGEEAAGEASTERKLSYLDYQAENMGHIDGGYTGELDVTSPNGVFAR